MLRNVHLYGNLAEQYGPLHRFDIATAAESCRALAANYKGFDQELRKGHYRVAVANDNEEAEEIDETRVNLKLGKNTDVHIMPVAVGSKNGGGLKVIAGLALLAVPGFQVFGALSAASVGSGAIAAGVGVSSGAAASAALSATAFSVAGFAVSYGSIASLGASLLISGISQAISKPPKVTSYANNGGPKSFLFNGALNRTQQGSAIPLVYGEFITGSVLGSASLQIEQLI